MNREFEIIWDCAIAERLGRGDLNVEMDIHGVLRAELEKRGLIGPDNRFWRCCHDIMLLSAPHQNRYDVVLMKPDQPERPEAHYPAVVAELKIWARMEGLLQDLTKIESLYGVNSVPSRSHPMRCTLYASWTWNECGTTQMTSPSDDTNGLSAWAKEGTESPCGSGTQD